MIKQILLLCLTLILSPVVGIKPQPQSPLYHNNLLTKEKLLYRGDIEDLWAAIDELRAAVFRNDRYYYQFSNYSSQYINSVMDYGNIIYETDWSSDGRFLISTNGWTPQNISISEITNGIPTEKVALTITNTELWDIAWSSYSNNNLYYFIVLNNKDTAENGVKLYNFNSSTNTINHSEDLLRGATACTNIIQHAALSATGEFLAIAGSNAIGELIIQIFSCDYENINKFTPITSANLMTISNLSHEYGISALSWNNNNTLAISYYEENNEKPVQPRMLKIYSFNGATLTQKIEQAVDIKTHAVHNNWFRTRLKTIDWNPEGSYLATILSNDELAIYNYANDTLKKTSSLIVPFISTLTWSPDGHYITYYHESTCTISNFNDTQNIINECSFEYGKYNSQRISWSPIYQNYSCIAYASGVKNENWGGGAAVPSLLAIPTTTTYSLGDLTNTIVKRNENMLIQNKNDTNTNTNFINQTRNQLFDRYVLADIHDFENFNLIDAFSSTSLVEWSHDGQFLMLGNNWAGSFGDTTTIKIFTVNDNGKLIASPLYESEEIAPQVTKWNPVDFHYFTAIDQTQLKIFNFQPTESPMVTELAIENLSSNSSNNDKWIPQLAWSNDGKYLAILDAIEGAERDDPALIILKIYKFDPNNPTALSLLLTKNLFIKNIEMGLDCGVKWTPSDYITIIDKTNSASIYIFNPHATEEVDKLKHLATFDENYKFLEWSPKSNYILTSNAQHYPPFSSVRDFCLYEFDNTNNTLTKIKTVPLTTMQDSDKWIYALEWDPFGEYILMVHGQYGKYGTIFKLDTLQEKTITKLIDFDVKQSSNEYERAICSWSKPYLNHSHIMISKSYASRGEHQVYSMTAIDRTLSTDVAERAIEVSTASSLFDFKISTTFDGNNKTYVLSGADQQLIKVALNQNVTFKNIILQNFNFNTINLQANASLFFDDQTTLALDGSQYEINRTYTFRGNCIINGNNSTVVFGPDAGFFVDSNATLLLQNITIKGLSDEQLRCMDCTSTVSLGGSVNLFMDGNYYFKQGKFALLPASQVNVNNEYNFYYQSPCPSIIGSAAVFQMTRNAKFYYEPQNDNHDLIQFANDDSIFCLKGATLVSSTTGMRLTKGTFKTNGENNYLYSSGTTLSDSIMLGNGIFEDNLFCQFEGSNVNIINGKVIWANVEE